MTRSRLVTTILVVLCVGIAGSVAVAEPGEPPTASAFLTNEQSDPRAHAAPDSTGDAADADLDVDVDVDPPERKHGEYNRWSGDVDRRASAEVAVEIGLTDAGATRLDALADAGVTVTDRRGTVVRATVPTDGLDDLQRLSFVEWVRPTADLYTSEVTSEGAAVVGADDVHERGITGAGVSVGIIDAGFDVDNPEIAANVVAARSFSPDEDVTAGGDTAHGTAVAEIVVDVAPDADLYVAQVSNAFEYERAVAWLRSEDVDVISMSGGFPVGPHDGTDFTDLAAAGVSEDDIVFVVSAGNFADGHWEGAYADADADGFHEFAAETELTYLNDGQPYAGPVGLFLMWNDWPASDQDYDLFLVEDVPDGPDEIVAVSDLAQDGTIAPAEGIVGAVPEGVYYLVVHNYDASGEETLELFSYNLWLSEYVPESSVVSPATAGDVVVVGAHFYATDRMESFSSEGPTNDGRPALDVAAPDGVSTTGLPTFFGTSASAPHVAGVVALMHEADPNVSAADTQRILTETATDVGDPGFDLKAGHGSVNATAAVAAVSDGPDPGEQTTTVDVFLRGAPDGLSLYNVTLAGPNESRIVAVEPALLDEDDAAVYAGGVNESFVTVRGADFDRSVGPFEGDRVLFSVTFEGSLTEAELELAVTALLDDAGADVDPSRVVAVIRSPTPEPVPEPAPGPEPVTGPAALRGVFLPY